MKTFIERVFGGKAIPAGSKSESLDYFDFSMPECRICYFRPDRLRELWKRIEKVMESKKLYLDPSISLTKLALMVGSNRTYLSNAMAEKSGFRNYLNSLRIKYFCELLEEREKGLSGTEVLGEPSVPIHSKDISLMAMESGFADMRTFQKAVGASDSEYAQRIKSELFLGKRPQ